MRIDIQGDHDAGGWFLEYVGAEPLPFLTFYTGPFASRSDAAKAVAEYKKEIDRALESGERDDSA